MLQSKLAKLWQIKFLDWKKAMPTGILLICVVLLAFKAISSWETLLEYEWQIRYGWLAPSFLLFLLHFWIAIWGWWSILNQMGATIPLYKHVKVYCYTTLARRIPAGLLWVVLGRAYWYRQLNVSATLSTAASLLELEMVILTGLPIAAIQLGIVFSLKWEYTLFIAGLALMIVAFLTQPNVLNQIRRVFKQESLPTNFSRQTCWRWTIAYTLIWLFSGVGLYVIVNLFYDLPLRMLPEMIGVWALASLVSYLTMLTPSGFGIKELSLTFLLGFYLPEPLPFVIALAVRALSTMYEIIAALVSLAL